MSASVTFNSEQFQKDLRLLVLTSRRTSAQVLNSKGYTIAAKAMENTKRASRADIEGLGIVGYKAVRSKKTGLTRRGKAIFRQGVTRAENILAARLRQLGQLEGVTNLRERAEKMIRRRLSSIAFLASGWIPAMRKLDKYAVRKAEKSGKSKPAKGNAIPAKEVWNPFVQIENNATPLNNSGGQNQAAVAQMESALSRAFNQEAASMERELKRRLGDDYRKLGATVK